MPGQYFYDFFYDFPFSRNWLLLAVCREGKRRYYSMSSVSPAEAGIVVIGGGIGGLQAAKEASKGSNRVTLILSNPFLEFTMAASAYINNPAEHSNWIAGRPADFQFPGVDYIFEPAIRVDAAAKTVTCASGTVVAYKALIVATGSKTPLMCPRPGDSVVQRLEEVRQLLQRLPRRVRLLSLEAGLCQSRSQAIFGQPTARARRSLSCLQVEIS